MLVLGISGGMDRAHENLTGLLEIQSHDSAAALIRDGEIVFACEQERLNRIKHTNKFASDAARACLAAGGVSLDALDGIAIYRSAPDLQQQMRVHAATQSFCRTLDVRGSDPYELLKAILIRDFGTTVARDRMQFVKHHEAHAHSAFGPSGFDSALVVTLDGEGDNESGSVAVGTPEGMKFLQATPLAHSLGLFYLRMTLYLGLNYFDEYKVMGLAPYGDAARFRGLCKPMYTLLPAGKHMLHPSPESLLASEIPRRHPADPLGQEHKDLAASIQEVIEIVALHLLRHFRDVTHLPNLCLAGGVAHNCTLTGKILNGGLFAKVFVQPASHDAGCAIGAALAMSASRRGSPRAKPLRSMYLGADIGTSDAVAAALSKWGALVSFTRYEDIVSEAAKILAGGKIIGWVQGRAEFGPRALGNRSILADPRPAENRDIINSIVKKREAFRPFAPAVLVERAEEFFEIPASHADLSHMTYTVKVREHFRNVLPAVTHVDGSARVQTVTSTGNLRFWSLIRHFGDLTGVPVLLNTSFNNNAEPIVDSVDDAIVCLLTTRLECLVAGDFVVTKFPVTYERLRELVPVLPRHVLLRRVRQFDSSGRHAWHTEMASNCSVRTIAIRHEAVVKVLEAMDGELCLEDLIGSTGVFPEEVFDELLDLWSRRTLSLLPRSAS
jgi:carbamoyltransferase